jgi:hypothetical protein
MIWIRPLAQRVQLVPPMVNIVPHKHSDADSEADAAVVAKMPKVFELRACQYVLVDEEQAEALNGRRKVLPDLLEVKELALAQGLTRSRGGYVQGCIAAALCGEQSQSRSRVCAYPTRCRVSG